MTRSVHSLPIDGKSPRLLLAALLASTISLSADSGAHLPTGSTLAATTLPSIIFVQAPKVEEAAGPERFPEGSRIVLLTQDAKDKNPRVLTEDFFAAADPQVDFTGQRVLFAAQKARGERWQIWEMTLDGSRARQVTKCEVDCVRPAYLPADEVAFTRVSVEPGRRHSSIEAAGLDGSNVHPVTFGPGQWWLETVLRDGRIVASANSPLSDNSTNRLLYTVRPDGTGLESLRCEHAKPANRGEASELKDGSVVFTEGSGALMAVKRGALHEERIGSVATSYRSPGALPNGAVIVASKGSGQARYQLLALSADGRETRPIYSNPKLDSVEPIAVEARPVPKKFWSNLIPNSPTGYFIALDSSSSMDSVKSAAPIKRVRVIAQKPAGEAVLGEAPVEADGSFYVKVPANQAVRFVLLDEAGQVIREEHSWVWTRPGEQRGCTGCHGDKALAPENRWPMALRRQDPPTNLSGAAGDTHTGESHGH